MRQIATASVLLAVGCSQEPVVQSDAEAPGAVAVTVAAIQQDALVTSNKDGYIRELAAATPAGGETSLRVQGLDRQRGLVAFDQAALLAAVGNRPVLEASLELTVQDMSWIWGQISAHRVKQTFTEAGATWVCANDTTPSNTSNNCTSANAWNQNLNPPFITTASDTQAVSNGMTVAKFNVTNDVKAFVNGSQANNGWLLKVVIEGVPGYVRFRTRESGAATAPKLILDLGAPPCTPTSSVDTTCNGVDDNCNGSIDEGYVASAISCGVGACVRSGTRTCSAGAVVDSCTPGTPAANDAVCDGVDNDCSGATDEDYVATATSCGVGACANNGSNICQAGAVVNTCAPRPAAATDATCDNIDDNCNGTRDEQYVATATSCGVGACASFGSTLCSSGHVVDTCLPGTPTSDDNCNNVDNDCDGTVDDDYAATPTTCGAGACQASGTLACSAGSAHDTCIVSCEGACDDLADDDQDGSLDCADADCASDAACGGQVGDPCVEDSDCSGYANGECFDEGETGIVGGYCSKGCLTDADCPSGVHCLGDDTDEFPGVCIEPCDNGTCAAGQTCFDYPEPDEDACFTFCNSDDDCNEDHVCMDGEPRVCQPPVCNAIDSSDATCDGIDDDCDGQTDEDFAAGSTSCGTAECAAFGTHECIDGVEVSSCVATCEHFCGDGEDDDQDGLVDCDDDECETSQRCGDGSVGDSCETDSDCSAYADAHCFPQAESVPGGYCSKFCADDSECPSGTNCVSAGNICIQPCIDGACGVGAQCSVISETDGDYCVPECSSDAECSFGYVCLANHICGEQVCTSTDTTCDGFDDDCDGAVDDECGENPFIGQPCTTNEECGAGGTCDLGFPGGYCYMPCDTTQAPGDECPSNTFCWLGSACILPCDANGECSEYPGYQCAGLEAIGLPPDPFCRPTCAASCPTGTTCDPASSLCF